MPELPEVEVYVARLMKDDWPKTLRELEERRR